MGIFSTKELTKCWKEAFNGLSEPRIKSYPKERPSSLTVRSKPFQRFATAFHTDRLDLLKLARIAEAPLYYLYFQIISVAGSSYSIFQHIFLVIPECGAGEGGPIWDGIHVERKSSFSASVMTLKH